MLFFFDCLPEHEGMSLFLKIPHTSVIRLREIEQVLTCKPHSWEITITVSEGTMQTTKRENWSISLASYKAPKPQQWQHWQNGSSVEIVTHISGVNDSCVIGPQFQSIAENLYLGL